MSAGTMRATPPSAWNPQSLIATPPVDRLAVRTFVLPFDPVVIREALLREKHRGGKSFIVTPRIQDIPELKAKIAELGATPAFKGYRGYPCVLCTSTGNGR